MKYIISGTNRPGSRSLQIAKLIQGLYAEEGEQVEIIDLLGVDFHEVKGHYGDTAPDLMKQAITKLNQAEGIVVVCPEYNGSYPGALKYFIDHWGYPETFEYRPMALVGLGGRFGGLRPVEHLQGVFGYRNAFLFPERVFIFDVWTTLKDGKIQDKMTMDLLRSQVKGFRAFTQALSAAGLDANSRKK
jgi:NAD(P)H-dependent FMN reductase